VNRFILSTILFFVAISGPAAAHDNPESELETLTARIALEPESAALHLQRAELHRFLHDWGSGLADLQTASRLDPSMASVDLALARLLFDADNLAGAREAADRFVERSPSSVNGQLVKARILLRSGDRPGAAAAFTRAIELDRDRRGTSSTIQPDDFLDRARALAESGRLAEAVAGLDEGLAALGNPIVLQLRAIELDEARGATDSALSRIATAEAAANRKEPWMARRGDLLARSGRTDEAERAYEDALRAIAALPVRAKDNAATVELEASVRSRLAALADRTTGSVEGAAQ
jgi:tetratricopeptide (TPR) repeat protein